MDNFGGKICKNFSILISNFNTCHYFLEFWGGENSPDLLLSASLREHRLQDGQGSESEAGECGGGPVGRTETPPPQDAAGRTDPHLSPLCEGRVWGQNEKSDKKRKLDKLTHISHWPVKTREKKEKELDKKCMCRGSLFNRPIFVLLVKPGNWPKMKVKRMF